MAQLLLLIRADQRLNIFSTSLVHTFHPACAMIISSVAWSSMSNILATTSRERRMECDPRQDRPARTVF